jgi:hypothetical protein
MTSSMADAALAALEGITPALIKTPMSRPAPKARGNGSAMINPAMRARFPSIGNPLKESLPPIKPIKPTMSMIISRMRRHMGNPPERKGIGQHHYCIKTSGWQHRFLPDNLR